MDALQDSLGAGVPPFEVRGPAWSDIPIVLASPHSGRLYDDDFLSASTLDRRAIRKSEDSFVDELLSLGPELGIKLLAATFPRAYCDVNRERWELDPAMFADRLPSYCNTTSPRVRAGFGTIARLVANGQDIYARKLSFAEAQARIHALWDPYHAALRELIETTVERLGICLLLDWHSMPSDPTATRRQTDFVLGDQHGTTCAPSLVTVVERHLRAAGHSVGRNEPYAGGFVTRHYGQPARGVHVLQVEISRHLYMDEHRFERRPGFEPLRAMFGALLARLAEDVVALRDA